MIGPRSQVASRWAAPGCLLLVALFVQNWALYTSTRRYVSRMDAEAARSVEASRRLVDAGEAWSFDCEAKDQNWAEEWSDGRKWYCCEQWAGQDKPWEVQKHAKDRSYCCSQYNKGCDEPSEQLSGTRPDTEAPKDCKADSQAFKTEYGLDKRRRCCESWKDSGELVDITTTKSDLAAMCCETLGDSCPDVVRSSLETTTRIATSTSTPPAPSPSNKTWVLRPGHEETPPEASLPTGYQPPAHRPREPPSGSSHEEPPSQAHTASLSAIALLLPVALLVATAQDSNPRLWTKCCICAALVSLLEGLIAVATQNPGSGGWSKCQERLGPAGLAYFRSTAKTNEFLEFFWILWELLRLERLGFWFDGSPDHLRFCSDTPLSGRSFLPAVCALGLYEFLWYRSKTSERLSLSPEQLTIVRACFGAGLCLVIWVQLLLLMNYQEDCGADLVVASIAAMLLFTNPTVTIASHQWLVNSKDLSGASEADALKLMADEEEDSNAGTILVPPCCLPLCYFQGRYVLHGFESYEEQVQQLSKRVTERQELLSLQESRCRESEAALHNVRTDLENMNRQRTADHEHLTSMCIEERKRRMETEETLESTKRETGKQLEEHRLKLEEEKKARQVAEEQQESTSSALLSVAEAVEQPRWSRPIRESLLRSGSPPPARDMQAWV